MSRTLSNRAALEASYRTLARVPAKLLLGLILIYQRTLSPLLPIVTMGGCACRFTPTCSHYAAEAVRTHGAIAGAWLAVCRLVKCTPLHPGGSDPVPVCRRVPQSARSQARTTGGTAPLRADAIARHLTSDSPF